METSSSKRVLWAFELVAAVLLLHYLPRLYVQMFAPGDHTPTELIFTRAPVGFAFTLVVLLWAKLRGDKLASFGLAPPPNWLLYTVYGVLLAVVSILFDNIVLPPATRLVAQLTGANPHQDIDTFADVKGNLPLYLTLLPCIWLFAGFGEEAFNRGYVMSRLAGIFGGGRLAWAFAIIGQAAIFALGHLYQGPVGMFRVFAGAILTGVAVRTVFKGNLFPAMIAHALIDTLAFTLLYLGVLSH